MPGRIESPSAQLGQLLLRGYTMLAAACEDCQLPLMRDSQTMQSHCVGCRRVFDSDGTLLDSLEAEAVPISSRHNASGPMASPSPPVLSSSNNDSNDQLNRPFVYQSTGNVAANGPVASSSAFPQQQQQQQQQPQQHDASDSDDEREVAEIRRRLEQQRLQQAYENHQRQRTAAAAGSGARDPSHMLADRLLAGWAMLAQSCPICHTPLMKSRDGEVRCIVCDLPVVIEQQQQPAREQIPSDTNAAADLESRQEPAAMTSAAMSVLNAGRIASSSSSPQKDETTADAPGTRAESRVNTATNTAVNEQQVLGRLQQVLLVKLQETTQQLDSLSSPQLTEMASILTVAQQLLHCLEKVKQVMSL